MESQRQVALREANRIRFARSQLKRELKAGQQPVDDILQEPPDWATNMKVFDVLLACPKYGRIKANKVMKRCRISAMTLLGQLTERQKAELIAKLKP